MRILAVITEPEEVRKILRQRFPGDSQFQL
jgi:hypothetical protein